MNITDIRVRRFNKDGKMKAIVSVTFDDEIVIHDIKVIEGDKGLFIAMPSRKTSDGEFRDIVHPINSAMRSRLQDAVLEKFEAAGLQDEDEAFGEAAATLQ
ncbi:MAG: septation regulator SpoVG [Defluviitaleaceae bacterium]|nr:septation regulator SpoVG [Defluviitaleaceae bacterium]